MHFGLGNFHRAHQASYLHELFEQGKDHEWAIVGAGVLEAELPQYEALRDQDFLTTVVEQSAEESTAKVIGSMIDYIKPTETMKAIETLSQEAIRIVSLTVTEGGYFQTETGEFDVSHPGIKEDSQNRASPSTVFGIIVAALHARREANIAPFTVMSCDNVPHNGDVARNAVCGLANLIDPKFSEWINRNVSFPNSMVDRITPVTRDRERTLVREQYRVADAVPVFCEDFRQWVLEDKFPSGRPSLEAVGVQFVDNVTPFELMKIRVLNGGHASIAYPAGLMNLHFVHEAMENYTIRSFLMKLEKEEILPAVPDVPGTNVSDYLDLIVRRFSNPKIGDTVQRLCFDGSNRQPKFIVPTIKYNLQATGKANGLALVSALWCKYCFGASDAGNKLEPNDPIWGELTDVAKSAKDDPVIWLKQKAIYGDLSSSPEFVAAFSSWLRILHLHGTEIALNEYLESAATAV